MRTSRNVVYAALDSERDYQEAKWQDADGGSNPLSQGEFILLAQEYIDRARKAWSVDDFHTAQNMIRKVGGIAVNCMEQHGAPFRETQIAAE